jgi:peptidoglycan hydrolase-like protein with peptidoglycan-binding domain
MHKHLQRVVVGALFVSLLFISTGKVFAETVDEATTDLPDTSGALCVDLPRDLSYTIQDSGDRHDVLLLQTFLQSRGFLKNNPTGYYGAQTRLAVRNFQIAVNLPGVGSIGPLTRAAIKNISCNSAPMPVTTTVAAVPPMCPAGYICRPPTDDSDTSVAVAGWKTYTDAKYNFQVKYPVVGEINSGTHFGGGILGAGEVQYAIKYQAQTSVSSPTEGLVIFSVKPVKGAYYPTRDALLGGLRRESSLPGTEVKSFDIANAKGVVSYTPTDYASGKGCSVTTTVYSGGFIFDMPAEFALVFAPQTGVGNCYKTTYTNSDYLKVVSSFKFLFAPDTAYSCPVGYVCDLASISSATPSVGSYVTLLDTHEDRVGYWDVFTPGSGNFNRTRDDWNWALHLSLPEPKTVKSISVLHNNGEGWSTASAAAPYFSVKPYPLLVTQEGRALNTAYDQPLNFDVVICHATAICSAANLDLKLYGQMESSSWRGGSVVVVFTDGSTQKINIPTTVGKLSTDTTVSPLCPTGYICTSPTANTVTTNSTSLGMPALSLSGHNLHISWTAYAADYYRIKLSNTAGASLPRNTALITTVDGSQNSFTTDIYEQIKSYLDINNLTSTADATLPGNFAKSFVITVEAVKKGVAGVSGTSQAFTMAVDGNRANVTVSADAIAKIRTTNEDYAGAWGQFKPGVGSANKDRADWGWSLTLTSVPYPRIIRDITITSDTQGWSTSDRGEFPLVVVNAGAQLNTSAGQTFTVPAYTTYTLFLYGQKESTQWSGGSIKITFSDGTSLTRSIAGISASSVSDATHKPVITMVRAKAGAPFEAYIGEDLDIEGVYLADSGGTAHVYFGPWGGSYGDAVTATTKQISDTLVRVTVPELSTGQNFLGISNRNGESSFVQVKVIRHEQSLTPTITATLMGSGADYAGKFGEFEPGVGLGNTTPADWQWSLKLSTSNARRVIKNITISHKSGVEAWSTANASAYPLVVVKNNNQLNFSYGDYITLLPNEDTLTLYGQREDTTWTHGNIEVNFTDGTTLRSDIQM